jgi:hypothetical protein
MTYLPRSVYEFGDPVHDDLAKAEQTDHYRAFARGRRVLLLADGLVGALEAQGLVRDGVSARRVIFCGLADELYGNAGIDVPDFTNPDSLAALRRGKA